MNSKIRVMLVDDHAMVREGLAAVIAGEPDMVIAGSVGSGRAALDRFEHEKPDVVLLDVRMPEMDGLATLVALRQAFPRARVIMLSSSTGDEAIHRALSSGALGYVLKSSPAETLLNAIRTAREGRVTPDNAVAQQLAKRVFFQDLSDREIEVLRQLALGARNKEISVKLSIAEGTVKNHVNNILEKLGVTDRTQAVTVAAQRGIIDLND